MKKYTTTLNTYDYADTIQKAASRARGDRLGPLYKLCEEQQTVSTKKLEMMIDKLWESDRQDAIHFKTLADRLSVK